MDKISALREEFEKKLSQIVNLPDLDKVRVDYLGKKGSVTALLKGMKELSNEEKKSFGAEVNKLKKTGEAGGSAGDLTVNVYGSNNMSVTELAAAVERRIIQVQKRRNAAWV